jgi:hypothetical protein
VAVWIAEILQVNVGSKFSHLIIQVISRLTACRYVEAVNSVYEYNTFRATNILASLFLPSFVAPRLLSKISYLDLHFVIGDLYIPVGSPRLPPDNEATWEEMWGVISAIRGLKMLRVRLSGCGMMHHEVETGLFESMKRCQAVDFTVSVSWAVEGETRNNDWPFSIQREPI